MDTLKSVLSEGTRPWGEMFERLQVPFDSSVEDLAGRIEANLAYFACNYALVALVVFMYSLISHPHLILFVLLAVGLQIILNTPDVVAATPVLRDLTRKQRILLALVVPLVLMFMNGLLLPFLAPFFVNIVLILLHALLRPRNMKSKLNHLKTRAEASELGQTLNSLKKDLKRALD